MPTNSLPTEIPTRAAFDRNVPPLLPGGMLRRAMDSRHRPGEGYDKWTGHDQAQRPGHHGIPDAIEPLVEIFPPNAVSRRTLTWTGMAAEIVQATTRNKIELRFRAPVHLLVVCERCIRSNGETFVEGLPRSALRDQTRKLTF